MSGPSKAALAAKGLVESASGPAFQSVLETRAVLGGWQGARSVGLYDTHVADAVAKAAWGAVWALIQEWAAECDEPAPEIAAKESGK